MDLNPHLRIKYGSREKKFCIQDVAYTISYLKEAFMENQPILFHEYYKWGVVFFPSIGVSIQEISC
jgi:hypothetical protein